MKKTGTVPWAYRKGSSFLHRLPGGLKLIFLLALSLAAFFPGLLVLPAAALILILGAVNAGLKPWELLRGSGPLFMIVLAVIALRAVHFFPPGLDLPGLKEGCLLGIRMSLSFCAGALLFSVTTMGEIKKSLAAAETFLGIQRLRLSLGLSLMLGFLPKFFEIHDSAETAWKSRGGKKNFRYLAVLIPLITERMMEAAAETSAALESRGALLRL
jgi:biotin transport system permease protein